MARRAVPVTLVLGAALADAAGAHRLAFYALLVTIPFAAAAALVSFDDCLDVREDSVAACQAMLWALVLALVVLGCASRAHALEEGALPAFAASALSGVLVVLAVKASLWVWGAAREHLARGLPARAGSVPRA